MLTLHPELATARPELGLAGSLTIPALALAREQLLQLLPSLPPGPLALSLAEVTEADSAGLQWLLAASLALREAGIEPVPGSGSEAVTRVARALGLAGADGGLVFLPAALPLAAADTATGAC